MMILFKLQVLSFRLRLVQAVYLLCLKMHLLEKRKKKEKKHACKNAQNNIFLIFRAFFHQHTKAELSLKSC